MSNQERLNSVVNQVAKNLGLKSYKYTRSGLDETIENYLGELVFVTINGETEDGEVKRDFVVKFAPNNATLRESGTLEVVYSIEIAVYTVLIPHFRRLSKFDTRELFPECLYSDCTQYEEVLAVSNMCSDGFRRHCGNRFLDTDHMIVSLKSLAKFHALSMVLKNDLKTEDWNNLVPNRLEHPPKYTTSLKLSWQSNLDKLVDTKHGNIFSMVDANFDDVTVKNTKDAKCLIYAHGDYWKENILFKYEDEKPSKACILDFQMTRLLSPAQDFLCFVYTSVDLKLRRQYYEVFLSIYYDCLKETLSDHGLNVDAVYSRDDLNHDFKVVAPYCLIYGNLSFSLWLGLENKAFVKSKNIDAEDNTNVLQYKEIMVGIVEDFLHFGYI